MDYKKINFKCGIEIHQQLNTHKLFCNCPSEIRKDSPDFIIKRYLRASAGESGKVDVAAKYEQEKNKEFIYQGYYDTTCLVETDDEPPGLLNQEALNIALQVAKLLNAKINDKIQFMRKVVVDGSNVSGFQRTALIARDGYIDVDGVKVNIPVICLEEEAAQAIKRTKEQDTYNLSRLGIPLIEIATAPDIISPEHCKSVAAQIGMILRSTGKVKRGIGTIRQDVNISIQNTARVEIKGFQDLKSIPKIIDYEINRRLKIIKNGKKPENEVRKAEPDLTTSFLRPMPGSARMYPETDVPIINITSKLLSQIKIPELIEDKIERLEKEFNISTHIAQEIIKKKINLFALAKKYKNIKPDFIASTIIEAPKEIKKRYSLDLNILKYIDEILSKLNQDKITKEAVFEILVEYAKGKKPNYSKYRPISLNDLEKEIKLIISKNKGAPIGALMGKVMEKYRGRVDGKVVMQIIKKNI
jgi:Glu-tRNA(Gln) amidotransferase subunit E-like FAD-binding protein